MLDLSNFPKIKYAEQGGLQQLVDAIPHDPSFGLVVTEHRVQRNGMSWVTELKIVFPVPEETANV